VRRRAVSLAPGSRAYRLLVADDIEAMRELMIRVLEPFGFDLRNARDGEETMRVWREWHPDLIWLDMRMPVMDGWEVARRIRAEANGSSPVLIAVTASGTEDVRNAAIAAGCDGFLHKPFDESALLEMLERHLGVEFLYSAETDSASASDEDALFAALASLPSPVLVRLEDALCRLEITAIEAATNAVAEYDVAAANRLRQLTDNYQYAELLRLIAAMHAEGAR
jgi:CheY-like chemotaxis protein